MPPSYWKSCFFPVRSSRNWTRIPLLRKRQLAESLRERVEVVVDRLEDRLIGLPRTVVPVLSCRLKP